MQAISAPLLMKGPIRHQTQLLLQFFYQSLGGQWEKAERLIPEEAERLIPNVFKNNVSRQKPRFVKRTVKRLTRNRA
jgi:hypothetical protein